MNNRPAQEEYSTYFDEYVRLVPMGNIQDILRQQLRTTSDFLAQIPEVNGNYRYAPGKWSLKQVIGHINDNERIMSYRLLRFARGDETALAGYDQDTLMTGISFDSHTIAELIEDYVAVRQATLTLLRGLSEEAWYRSGTASENKITVNAQAYVIAGHELHHLNIIQEKYIGDHTK